MLSLHAVQRSRCRSRASCFKHTNTSYSRLWRRHNVKACRGDSGRCREKHQAWKHLSFSLLRVTVHDGPRNKAPRSLVKHSSGRTSGRPRAAATLALKASRKGTLATLVPGISRPCSVSNNARGGNTRAANYMQCTRLQLDPIKLQRAEPNALNMVSTRKGQVDQVTLQTATSIPAKKLQRWEGGCQLKSPHRGSLR